MKPFPRNLLAIAGVFFLGVSGCRRNSLTPADLTGTWVITDDSRKLLPSEFQKLSAQIFVNADGSFKVSELPVESHIGKPSWSIFSGAGIWKIISMDGDQELLLDFQSFTSGRKNDGEYGFPLHTSRWWSTLNLSYMSGDPELWVELEKK